VGIVGRNGCGKTTLLRLLTGETTPRTGTVERGARADINLIDQHRLQIDPNRTVWDEVGEGRETVKLGEENVTLRGYLRRFLFKEEQLNQIIGQLSGGERSRVLLAKILKRGGNVLILDEPTNDLDLATLRILEEALVQFKGTVVVVSHDRYFLNRVCTHVLAIEGDGSTVFNVGNYDQHLALMASRRQKAAAAPTKNLPKQPTAPPTAAALPTQAVRSARGPKLSYKEERELEGIEAAVTAAEEAAAAAEATLNSPDLYKKTPAEISAAQAGATELRAAVAALYARWEELDRKKAACSID
jgi:ATP-binding cassette subfamily F protein uup